jgi:mannose-6-phosphate isomerase-like protein (cupin superfamily)
MMLKPSFASESRKRSDLRMMASFLITRGGPWSSTGARSGCRNPSTPRPYSAMAGGILGGTASTTMFHYHSRIHEVLGIARGTGRVQFGGPKGRPLTLKAGDVAILPAGTGHQRLEASGDFLVVGAYPPAGVYDECTSLDDRPKALPAISRAAGPRKDPVYGKDGPLTHLWRQPNRRHS